MSSRNQSLYRRLDDLLPQLDKLLIESLQQEVVGKRSTFISRLIDHFYDGRIYQRPEVEHAEDIASEVISLKEKLGEPLSEGATGIILCYAELKENRKHLYGEERTNFAKAQLLKLGAGSKEDTPTEAKPISRSKTNDKISKPSKGRYFPVSTSEVISLIHELSSNTQNIQREWTFHLLTLMLMATMGLRLQRFILLTS